MSSSKTSNLRLHSWAASDAVVRTEFNENFNLIDAAVGTINSSIGGLDSRFGTCTIYSGYYVGTGEGQFSLSFDRIPEIIFFQNRTSANLYSGFVREGISISAGTSSSSRMSISGNSITFIDISGSPRLNMNNSTYYYAAICPVN